MVYTKIITDTPYIGTQNIILVKYEGEDELSKEMKKELDDLLEEFTEENAENYSWDVSDEDMERYFEECCENSYWEEISKEEYSELLNEGWGEYY